MNIWAIINDIGNYIENLIVWNGDENEWTPPEGTSVVRIEDIDYSTINENPQNSDINDFVKLKKHGHTII